MPLHGEDTTLTAHCQSSHLQLLDRGSDGVHLPHDGHQDAAVAEVSLVLLEEVQQVTPLFQDVLLLLANCFLSMVIFNIQLVCHLGQILKPLLLWNGCKGNCYKAIRKRLQ